MAGIMGQITVNVAGKAASAVSGASKSGGGGIMGNILGAITSPLGIIATGMGLLVASSGLLRNVLTGIGKTLLLILKPIGDILGVALMPILFILRPIGLFFNTLMRPYIQKAMEAMRAGNQLLQAGDTEGAAGAFNLGFQFLAQPLFNGIISGFTLVTQNILTAVRDLGTLIISVIPDPLGALAPLKEGWNSTMNNLITKTGDAGTTMKNAMDTALNTQLQTVIQDAETATKNKMPNISKNIIDNIESAETSSKNKMPDFTTNIDLGFTSAIGSALSWGTDFAAAINDTLRNGIDVSNFKLPSIADINPTIGSGLDFLEYILGIKR
jgi:hypothetical protein